MVRRLKVDITTDSGGAATVYSPTFTGRLLAIHYVKNDFANGVDFAITGEQTAENVWTELNVNASKSVAPRMATYGVDGAAALYAAGGAGVFDYIGFASDRLKFIIAQGGDTKSGTFYAIVGD